MRDGSGRVLRRALRSCCVPLAFLALAGGAGGAAPPAADGLAALRQLDGRVADAGYRLLTANAALCRTVRPEIGLGLHAIDQYARTAQPAARAAFGFAAPVSVETVTAGGPADRAGVRPDDGLLAVAGRPVGLAAPAPGGAAQPASRDRALATIAALPPSAPMTLTLTRDGQVRRVTVRPVPACAATVELTTDGGARATSSAHAILIGMTLAARIDDAGLAVVLAHELAHVVLEHRRRLDAAGVRHGVAGEFGRNRRLIRRTEDEADRLSAWLLANAGIDPGAAARFWRGAGSRLDGGPFRSRTHSGAATRARLVEGEMPALAAVTARPARPAWIDQMDTLP